MRFNKPLAKSYAYTVFTKAITSHPVPLVKTSVFSKLSSTERKIWHNAWVQKGILAIIGVLRLL
jgi:hypothetical protein